MHAIGHLVVAVDHDHDADGARGQAPAVLPRVRLAALHASHATTLTFKVIMCRNTILMHALTGSCSHKHCGSLYLGYCNV